LTQLRCFFQSPCYFQIKRGTGGCPFSRLGGPLLRWSSSAVSPLPRPGSAFRVFPLMSRSLFPLSEPLQFGIRLLRLPRRAGHQHGTTRYFCFTEPSPITGPPLAFLDITRTVQKRGGSVGFDFGTLAPESSTSPGALRVFRGPRKALRHPLGPTYTPAGVVPHPALDDRASVKRAALPATQCKRPMSLLDRILRGVHTVVHFSCPWGSLPSLRTLLEAVISLSRSLRTPMLPSTHCR
jgi:hypothetical protein